MPRAETTRGLEPGTLAEVRVAQAWFWDGFYVRRGIDLQHRFGPDVTTVTDLDILGYAFDTSLGFRKRIGEVKSGKSSSTPRPLDRAIWVHGLQGLVGAGSGEVTTAFWPTGTIRDACRTLGVTVQHLDDLAAREQRLRIGAFDDLGSQGVSIAILRKDVQAFVKTDSVLERGFWFLASEVWFLEPLDALKRTLGLIRELSRLWPPSGHRQAEEAARWFFAEAISIATLNLAIVAGEANTMDAATFKQTAAARLATGDVSYHAMQKLSEHVDEYLGKILTSLDAPADVRISAMGAFAPSPPDYTEPLLELISRLAASAGGTARLPRQMDLIIFERLVRRRDAPAKARHRLGIATGTERMITLVGAFLRGQFDLPAPVNDALAVSRFDHADESADETQGTLFERAGETEPNDSTGN
ncbi:DNA-binding response regulator [Paractinoplanes brasiliensis]|uniref:Uncharacterized protein n=1 Tax=Paractinoplanes brasiliensis TaxID=52695 RepID=A0A4R6JUM4_9ACTN|nr:DNA-binding response regulator [Actinoplanes brasiliensis]TDO39522.1 hypothetical protein C8E87_3213 [Actinoplanes brasiliensis]GID29140.1 hypothetical protein Abr02nite_41230 [Actinoplanes brasiliensis]